MSQKSEKTLQNVMTAILQTAGPVSTPEAIRWGWKFLREACSSSLSTDFLEAGAALEKTGLGYSSKFSVSYGRTSRVFIKRKPEEAVQVLSAIPGLCDPEICLWRYAQLPPKCIGLSLRSKMVALKMVSQRQMT